jgi:hypothetical protein
MCALCGHAQLWVCVWPSRVEENLIWDLIDALPQRFVGLHGVPTKESPVDFGAACYF